MDENFDSPSILVISLSKALNFLGDGSIYEGRAWRHKPNLLKFYQGMVRSYHGTMLGFMFFKHLFHFFDSRKPNKQTFMVDYCHTFHRNICPYLVKGMRTY